MEETRMMDIEPKWIDLVPNMVWCIENDIGKTSVIKELKKMARCCDKVRQAQKRKVEMIRVCTKSTGRPVGRPRKIDMIKEGR
jgi:hypothetical protein